MYVKFHNAAVYVDGAVDKPSIATQKPKPFPIPSASSATLWSDRPFTVPQGRLIGIRKTGLLVYVALIAPGTASMVWLPADSLLSQSQINRWLSSSSFRTK